MYYYAQYAHAFDLYLRYLHLLAILRAIEINIYTLNV